MEIWDGQARQPGEWHGFQVKRKWPALLPLTIAEVRMQFGKIHGIALVVLGLSCLAFSCQYEQLSRYGKSKQNQRVSRIVQKSFFLPFMLLPTLTEEVRRVNQLPLTKGTIWVHSRLR